MKFLGRGGVDKKVLVSPPGPGILVKDWGEVPAYICGISGCPRILYAIVGSDPAYPGGQPDADDWLVAPTVINWRNAEIIVRCPQHLSKSALHAVGRKGLWRWMEAAQLRDAERRETMTYDWLAPFPLRPELADALLENSTDDWTQHWLEGRGVVPPPRP
jgi:hypothetical protein